MLVAAIPFWGVLTLASIMAIAFFGVSVVMLSRIGNVTALKATSTSEAAGDLLVVRKVGTINLDHLRLILESTRRVEDLLGDKFGLRHTSINAQIDEIREQSADRKALSQAVVDNARLVATIRNKMLHEVDYFEIRDPDVLINNVKAIERQLCSVTNQGDRNDSTDMRHEPPPITVRRLKTLARVLEYTRPLEHILKSEFGAEAQGLATKALSLGGRLPLPVIRQLEFCARCRNEVLYEAQYRELDGENGFIQNAREVHESLCRIKLQQGWVSSQRKATRPQPPVGGLVDYFEESVRITHAERGFGWLVNASIVWGVVAACYYPFETLCGYPATNPFALFGLGFVAAMTLPPLIGVIPYLILRTVLQPIWNLSAARTAGTISTALYFMIIIGSLLLVFRAVARAAFPPL